MYVNKRKDVEVVVMLRVDIVRNNAGSRPVHSLHRMYMYLHIRFDYM